MFTAFCADGSCLPPVIITKDKKLKDVDFSPAHVIVLANTKGQSNRATECWFDESKDFLADEPLLLLDNHKSFHSINLNEEMSDFSISVLHFPVGLGCYLNPCDNSLHSLIKQHYRRQQHTSHEEMIVAICDAYYAVSEEQVRHFFAHTGITSHITLSVVAKHLLEEGYWYAEDRDVQIMMDHFHHWKYHHALLYRKKKEGTDLLYQRKVFNGVYWGVPRPM